MAFCTDDREPEHIADEGHVNSMVRVAVEEGVPPEDALVLATLNPATWHGLREHGAVAPGYRADLLLLPDLERFVPELVLKGGTAGRRDHAARGARVGEADGARAARRRRPTSRCRRSPAARA